MHSSNAIARALDMKRDPPLCTEGRSRFFSQSTAWLAEPFIFAAQGGKNNVPGRFAAPEAPRRNFRFFAAPKAPRRGKIE